MCARGCRPPGSQRHRQGAFGCLPTLQSSSPAPSGGARGAFTVDIYNCMFGPTENSPNLFLSGDLAR
eukprot:5500976-Pyramimonas_sp.AAC.1